MRKFVILLFVALVFRLILVFVAYHGDLNNNISWGTLAVQRGLAGFYEGKDWPYSAPNQPPLTILLFALVRLIWQGIENVSWWLNNNFQFFPSPFIWFWEHRGMTLLVKLPSMFADLGIAWLIYRFLKQKKNKLAFLLSAVWLFNPVSWYNSSIWGQTDSIVNFLGLAGIMFLLEKRLIYFFVFFTMSLLFKGSLSLFIPILGFIALWQKHRAGQWARAIGVSLLTIILLSVWFHPALDVVPWLVNLYRTRILPGEVGFLTANAFNFWWLVDPGRTLDSTVYLGLPARRWGFAVALIGVSGTIFWLRKKISDKNVFYALCFISLLAFLFMTRIHERYLYPLFPSATILLGLIPGFTFPYAILSVTHVLNLYHLFWAPSFAPLEGVYKTTWFADTIAIINLASLVWVLKFAKKS